MQEPSNTSRFLEPQLPTHEPEDDGIDILGYLRIIQRRWLLIVLTMLVAVGLTAFVTLRMTKIYRATTKIRIETQAPQVLGREVEDVVEMGTGSFWSNIEYYETQYKIIESRDVASRIVQEFRLNEDPEFLEVPLEERDDFEPVTLEEAAQVLQGITTVEPIKDSRLVMVHVDNQDPQRAQLYANAVAKAYRDKNLESMLQSTVDAVDWLSTQLDDAKEKLNESEDSVREYKKENNILSISLEDRQNILTAQMTAAATKLTEARAHRIEVEARKKAISEVVKSDNPMAIPLGEINSNTLIQQLKQQHGELSQEYGELSERYGDKFPQMIELKAKIGRIRNDIAREVKNVLSAVNAELTAARATEVGIDRALGDLRSQALKLTQKELSYNRLARDQINNEKVYDLLLGRSKEADLSRLLRVNNVHILDPALLPEVPIKPRLRLNLALSMVIGLLIGLGLALLVEFTDRTVKTQDDLEALGVAFLGIVPSIDLSTLEHGGSHGQYSRHGKGRKKKKHKKKKIDKKIEEKPINYDRFVHDYPKSQVAESCRAIRTNLLFMSADSPAKRILITSPSPQEGKTTVAVNLAITMAQSGSSVLLVDTDMRRPRVHKAFDLHPRKGISTMVLGESTMEESVTKTGIPNLDILTCGPAPPNPSELMHTESFVRVIEMLSKEYDRVIFDSPPVAVVTDAAILSKLVDGTVLIVKSLQTTRDAAKHSVSVLRDIGATILGAVLNDLDLANRKYGQHYYYYYYKKYGYYYQSEDEENREPVTPAENEDRHPPIVP
ncbi:MAG: polysaccharide biosynthesis tyrosine autokinase [Deltaproteobacteria bacterium]|nr:polysaccharide biosynthesis tyrosine autokinase [Deltaproteobacteria bacterium]